MNISQLARHAGSSFTASVLLVALLLASFFLVEPAVSRGQASDTSVFTVEQTITAEISFLVDAADVTMDGSIAGLTGGNSTGTTFAVVQTNDPAGYNMTITFGLNGGTTTNDVMLANDFSNNGGKIGDYATNTEADFEFVATGSGEASQLAYTVSASNTPDLDPSFLDDGSACNTGAGDTANRCWIGPTTTNPGMQIVNRSSDAPNGATTTIKFKVQVPSNPSPSLPADTYTATATLTATNNT